MDIIIVLDIKKKHNFKLVLLFTYCRNTYKQREQTLTLLKLGNQISEKRKAKNYRKINYKGGKDHHALNDTQVR